MSVDFVISLIALFTKEKSLATHKQLPNIPTYEMYVSHTPSFYRSIIRTYINKSNGILTSTMLNVN